ncbi:MAG TPA: glycerol-3-phosphate dehydrogenase/oxidase [Acidobacteria bacterium]|nr:glycerol-3-phosphate dehydrogenase/oxidase [Acidobacteriota bacterium]
MFSPGWREEALAASKDGFDVIVIGGGISGCGIALDAAQRGLDVLVIEQGDIASGTSSRSTKLVHGGLRYLKQLQFRITRLACRERDRMLQLDPHLVRPVQFLYPAYEGDRTPGWKIDLGLWMYDKLAQGQDRHHRLTAEEVTGLAPGLLTENLDRALLYRDAMADDARLTLAVASTAAAFGARFLSRCRVTSAVRNREGRVGGVKARDLESGKLRTIRAHVVINAAGVWVDELRARMGFEERHLRPSRGSHIILRRERLPLEVAVAVPAPDDGRPVCLIPHPEGVLVGTTDLYHEGPLNDPRPTAEEIAYLLRTIASVYPDNPPGESDIVGAFAGLRPILDTHAEDPSEASREEDIWEEEGLVSAAGGKLTTWRVMAEEAVDAALELLPPERARRVSPSATDGCSLTGLAPVTYAARLREFFNMPEEVASAMVRRLGALAWTAAAAARREKELTPLAPGLDLCLAEARAWIRHGAVLHVEDLLLRRVRIGMWDPATARDVAWRLRMIFQRELGWSFVRWSEELERFEEALEAWTPEGIV